MSSYFLKQPNGKIAHFSDVVDNFTFTDMNEAEALNYAAARWGENAADDRVAGGVCDDPLGSPWDMSDGLNRWRSALTSIALTHGIDGVKSALADMGCPDADIPQSALNAALQYASV